MNSITVARETAPIGDHQGDLGAIISRRKWQILGMFLFLVALVTVVTLQTPKQYAARMKILVKNERINMNVSSGTDPQAITPGEVSETEINTEIELLNNNDLLRQVAVASGLDRPQSQAIKSSGEPVQGNLENAVNRLQHDLKILPVRKSNIIEIDYTAASPHQAVEVLRQLAASYLDAHLRVHRNPGTHDFFLSQVAQYQASLTEAEKKLTDFRQKNNIYSLAQQKEDVLRRASESSAMLLAAETSIHEYKQRIANARGQVSAAEPRVLTQSRTLSNQNSVERLGTMLVELQNRRTQLLSKYRSDDRLVQEVSQEIEDTKAAQQQAKSLTGSDQTTDVNPVSQTLALEIAKEQNELAGLEARREKLMLHTDGYRQQLGKLSNASAEYDDLLRAQKGAEDNYLLYARKAEEARIADSLDQRKIVNVAVAEHPVEPSVPSKPNVPLNLAGGALLAAVLSLGIALSLEFFAKPMLVSPAETQPGLGTLTGPKLLVETVEQRADLEAITGLPVLAVAKRRR